MKNTAQVINCQAIVPEHLAEKRLDQILSQLFPAYSRTRLQEWIRLQQVWVDDEVKRPRDKIKAGAKITILARLSEEVSWEPEELPLDIIYEDETLLVVNKPAGLVVHPAAGNPHKTLVNALLHYLPELNKLPRGGIIHRLDKDTSGLLIIPKTLNAYTKLVKQLQARTMKREYVAVIQGHLISGGTINAPIGRHPRLRKKMAVTMLLSGKQAISHYRVIERFTHHTLIKVTLETGRTHQIRVHMAHVHHPLVGDKAYGHFHLPKKASVSLINCLRQFPRQALHAQCLGIIHPNTLQPMEWESPLPEDMKELIHCLREDKLNA
jgi:23S rRNA pseudouridine1911/1915/1917 synthase